MVELDIRAEGEHAYTVCVTDDRGEREHHALVPESMLDELGVTVTEEPLLVRAAMEYLVERDLEQALPARFALDEIGEAAPDLIPNLRARLDS